MAQLACLNKELHNVYLDRVKQRDAVFASLVDSHFPLRILMGLSDTPMALPRDLIVNPPVHPVLVASCSVAQCTK
jgi:hypothetical protein